MNSLLKTLSSYVVAAREYASNVAWMLFERVWLLASSVIIGFWVIRSLGPEEFGRFSAALAITTLLATFSTAGTETAVLRRLAVGSENARTVVMAAITLRFTGSVIYSILCWVTALLLFPDTREVAFIAFVVGSGAIFRAVDVIGLWLQTENRYGRAAQIRIVVRVAGDLIRLALIASHASVIWFAVAMLIESIIGGAIFAGAGKALLFPLPPHSKAETRSLLNDGWPIMLSALIAACYARIDQLVLYNFLGATENGYYAAAARISESFNVVLLSVSTVAASEFGRLSSMSANIVEARLRKYYRSMFFAGLALSAILSLGAESIVTLVYGEAFKAAAPILRIHAWSLFLVCTSVALEPWFYHHRKLGQYIPKSLLALIVSVPAAIYATTFFGAEGTAAALVVTYFVSVFASNALLPGAQDAFKFQLRSLRN